MSLAPVDERAARAGTPIERLSVTVCRVPTDAPESDGTFAWTSTTLVVVHATAGGRTGLGWSYAAAAAARVIADQLAPAVRGRDARSPVAAWHAMREAVRNVGRPGIASCAIAAVDIALWDLAARLAELPLARALGLVRARVPVYGSGGFTSYPIAHLQRQLAGFAAAGMRMVKMKVGRDRAADPIRMRAAREAIGADTQLFVDANGACDVPGALALATEAHDVGATWLEEPVSSDDVPGLRAVRDRLPPGMALAAGEYVWEPHEALRLLQPCAVDVLQLDVTRCQGCTGFMRAAALAEAMNVPVSAHCAPALHAAPCCAAAGVRHVEYFHDHARIEGMLFDGVPRVVDGVLAPDLARAGHGMTLRAREAARFEV